MTRPEISILGFGAAVPESVRSIDDPLFEPARRQAREKGLSEASLFYGNREHRYLKPGESLASLTVRAGREALANAGVGTEQVDRLYGYLSVSEFISPSALYKVHQELGLPQRTLVLPIHADFANFVMSTLLAWEAMLAGHATRALVTVGTGWTRNLDYSKGHSLGIGDGAGAAVIGPGNGRLVLVDHDADTFSQEYGAMTMRHQPQSGIADRPVYGLDSVAGMEAFLSTGMDGPPRLVNRLLQKHGLTGDDITFVAHQGTRKLIDHWADKIRPREYLHTFEEYGNMLFASAPITLARHYRELRTKYLVLFGIGIGAHQLALLVRV
jgi:3-oxoacyl-[acyl-carrier-protein] synthase-3